MINLWLPYLNVHLTGLIEFVYENGGSIYAPKSSSKDKRPNFKTSFKNITIIYLKECEIEDAVEKSRGKVNLVYGFDIMGFRHLSTFFRKRNIEFSVYSEPPFLWSPKFILSVIKQNFFIWKNSKVLKKVIGIGYLSRYFWLIPKNMMFELSHYYPYNNLELINEKVVKRNYLFVGALIFRKGIIFLILIHLLMSPKNEKLLIIGDGYLKLIVKFFAKYFSKIKFLGPLSNLKVQKHITMSKCLILPSWWDGYGVVAIESIISSTPVVLSPFCGSRELKMSNKRSVKVGVFSWYLNGCKLPNQIEVDYPKPENLISKLC